MRRLITTTISALAAGVALLAGTGPAHADVAPIATQSSGPSSVVTAASEDVSAAATWRYHNWYWTIGNCWWAGQELKANNDNIINIRCGQNWAGTWDLDLLWR